MLTRTAGVVVASFALLTAASTQAAAEPVKCPPTSHTCYVDAEKPGRPGTPSPPTDQSGGQTCTIARTGEIVPCTTEFGWFNAENACYYRVHDPQPPAEDSVWQGRYPEGAVYLVTCAEPLGGPGTNGGWVWLPTPPAGFGVDPGELAERAVETMRLEGPAIRTPIDGDEIGTVGIPLWLWTEQTPTTWGPASATASVPGLSVTATATALWIDWEMGDGATVRCEGPGTPYIEGQTYSPTCQHIYEVSSAGLPGDKYTVTGTTTWEVQWSGGGVSGVLHVERSSSMQVPIGELHVLNTY